MNKRKLVLMVAGIAGLALAGRAAATSATIVVSNLPDRGATAEGQVVALAGTLTGWDNTSTLATVSQHRLVFSFPSLDSLPALGTDWKDAPPGANAAFQFLVPGSWSERAVKADFPANDGNFRVALQADTANTVEINAGTVPTLVDQSTALRLNGAVENATPLVNPAVFAFPGGRYKALVMSYDDGHVQDRGLAPLLSAHGIKGTFHLNSGFINQDTFIGSGEVATLFAGHEVSSHTVDHPYLTQLGDGSVQWEASTDRAALAALAGYAMPSMSYPFGDYNKQVMSLLAGQGVPCSRTVQDTFRLDYLPPNPLKWHPTCHHAAAAGLAAEFVARTNQDLALLFIWGHSYELDYGLANNSWAYLESLCQTLGDRGDTWYAGMGEVHEYLSAIRALVYPAAGCVSNPSPGIVVWSRLGGALARILPGKQVAYPAGAVEIAPTPLAAGATVTIRYTPGANALGRAAAVHLRAGHDGWQEIGETAMSSNAGGTWSATLAVPAAAQKINFAFTDGLGTWDDNGGSDWAVAVSPAVTGTPAVVQLAPGSPGVAGSPTAGQNHIGEAFDFNETGAALAGANAGGFGSWGSVYLNYDATNLYLGATGSNVGGSNNAFVVFLAIDTLADGAANLWTLRGTPFGLDLLHNVALAPAAGVAMVLGDEHGDGTFSHFNLGSGYDFGQGVYYLSSNATAFIPVPGARLAQFDGTGTTATATADDDGDRRAERWEVAIPWASLNAPLGAASVGSLHVSGLMASDAVSGTDRYLSANYLGSAAGGVQDGFGNFGFNFVSLAGQRVGLPGADSDLDGMGDRHETMAGTDPADARSLLQLGTSAIQDGRCVLRFDAVAGKQYQLQYREDLLAGGSWMDLDAPFTGAGSSYWVTNSLADATHAYYRLRLNAP